MMEAWEAGDMERVVEIFQHSWTDGPYRSATQVDPIVRDRVRTMALERIKRGPSEGKVQPLAPPALHRLEEIHITTLTIVGDMDMPDIHAVSDLLIKGIAGAEKVVMTGVAHMVNMERPAEFNRIVLDFLARTRITSE
jgi:pimeloyl-ACP methyl ester carboxylesterase